MCVSMGVHTCNIHWDEINDSIKPTHFPFFFFFSLFFFIYSYIIYFTDIWKRILNFIEIDKRGKRNQASALDFYHF